MANKDWYWDQFAVDVKGTGDNLTLDLSDEQTSFLRDQELTDLEIVDYETRFIDDLYGTQDRQWETNRGETLDAGGPTDQMYRDDTRYQNFMSNDAEIGMMGSNYRGRSREAHADWGLDLRRTMLDDDGDLITKDHEDYYTHLTQGDINWASYEKDEAFLKALKDIGQEKEDLTDDEEYSLSERVQMIRDANEVIGRGEDDDGDGPPTSGYEYDKNKNYTKDILDDQGNVIGKDLYLDGVRQETLLERYAKGEGRLDVGFTYTRKDEDGNDVKVTIGDKGELGSNAYDPIAGPPSVVIKPNIKAPNVRVQVPDSLKQWRSLAAETLKVGGDRSG